MRPPLVDLQLDSILSGKGVAIDKVINLKVDDKVLIRRVLGRWVCWCSRAFPTKPAAHSRVMYKFTRRLCGTKYRRRSGCIGCRARDTATGENRRNNNSSSNNERHHHPKTCEHDRA